MGKRTICQRCSKREDGLNVCPCGKHVCEDCTDRSIYCDQEICVDCANGCRDLWNKCPNHEYGEPYTNELGQEVAECKHCDYPKLVGYAPRATPRSGGRLTLHKAERAVRERN